MICPACRFLNPSGFRFCGQCGERLQQDEAERRQLTVMFFDLVGSTTLSSELDPEELRDLVRRYQARCGAVVERYQGHVAQYLGDGILVYFGYPQAHSDDGWRAVSCSLSILAAMQELRDELAAEGRPRLDLRVGIHTGLVVVGELGSHGHREQLAVGETPNVAARLQGLAEVNQVVFSQATYDLVGESFDILALGPHQLKGVPTPVPVYQALGWSEGPQSRQRQRAKRAQGPFLGRGLALAELCQRWQAAKEGRGQWLELLGPSGMGKSRLLQEFKEAALTPEVLYLSCYPEPQFQESPWWAVKALWERELRFAPPELSRSEKLFHVLQQRTPGWDSLHAGALLCHLLELELPPHCPAGPGLSPTGFRQQLLQLMLGLVHSLEPGRPWLLVVDGSDWLDPSSKEWLLQLRPLLSQGETPGFVILAGERPLEPDSPHFALEPLTAEDGLQLLQELGGSELEAGLLQQVLERSGGVPLHLEELLRQAKIQGSSQLSGKLRDAFAARLDQLGSAKKAAQLGAVIGRRFSRRLLGHLGLASVDSEVKELIAQGVVKAVAGRDELIFESALLQEAAYESLLRSRRMQLHGQVGDVLEQFFAAWSLENPEILAHHWEHSLNSERSLSWLVRAVQRDLGMSALKEACASAARGLSLVSGLGPTYQGYALQFHCLQGAAMIGLGGYAAPQVAECYGAARQICLDLGDGPEVFAVLAGLWALYLVQGRLPQAADLSRRLAQVAEASEPPQAELHRHLAAAIQGQTLMYLGQLEQAKTFLTQAARGPRDGRALSFLLTEPSIASASYLSWCELVLGRKALAQSWGEQALSWARQLDHPHTLAHSLFFESWLHFNLGQPERARAACEELSQVAALQAFPFWAAMSQALGGLFDLVAGQAEALPRLHAGLQAAAACGAQLGQTWWLAQLVKNFRALGQHDLAQGALSMALEVGREAGERWHWPLLLALDGQLEEARRIARQQGSLDYLESQLS